MSCIKIVILVSLGLWLWSKNENIDFKDITVKLIENIKVSKLMGKHTKRGNFILGKIHKTIWYLYVWHVLRFDSTKIIMKRNFKNNVIYQ